MNKPLYRYSQFTVVAAFMLILIGSLVTTNGAGMAFADWPLSAGSLNPEGWWSHLFQRLEHGHRLFAELTGVLIGILCAWVWANRWAFPLAIAGSGVLSATASAAGVSREWIAHIGLWSAALIFACTLFLNRKSASRSRAPLTRWLAFAAFFGVVIQAVLGGLRVTVESAGHPEQAMVIRIIHGCFAQIELCLLVSVAATLSPKWPTGSVVPGLSRIRRLAWLTFGFAFLQLALGAAIRHLGIALVIPTFPLASEHGLMPPAHNAYIDLNFTHTRFMALLVAVHVILLWVRVRRSASSESRLMRPAWLLLALLAAQIVFGISIIWTYRNPWPTTLHVINGAALLATSLLIALRVSALKAEPEAEAESLFNHPLQPGMIS